MKKFKLIQFVFLFIVLSINAIAQQKTNYKFSFGPGKTPSGYIQVKPEMNYAKEVGYGFDFGTNPKAIDRSGKDPLKAGFCTSDKPFYFSVALPEGNYAVKITMGDLKEATTTTVRAESRRMMLEKVQTTPGKFETKTIMVNIRIPEIAGTSNKVKLKPRELTKLNWDDKLTLEFANTRPCINAIEINKVEDVITVYLAGNSTVVDQDDEPWASWGQMIPRFFKPGVAFANHAESGLTLGSFLGSKRLGKVLSVIKKGDYLFIEFGHNDQKDKGADDGAWKSYTIRLKLFINETRKKGGIPVVVTSTSRRSFDSTGKIVNSLGDFPAAARKAAQEEGVALIDLNEMSKTFYEALGDQLSKKAFVYYPANSYPGQTKALADNTHFNPYGAYELAKCVIEGIRANKLGIASYLVDNLPVFDPAHPDDVTTWHWPGSPKSTVIKPDGN